MKTETSKEQTRKLIQLGCPKPEEVDNWILDMLTQDHLSYYDEDSCIRVLKNYSIGEVLEYFISASQNKKYKIVFDGVKWSMEIDETVIENNEYIDLLVSGIEKLMEGNC